MLTDGTLLYNSNSDLSIATVRSSTVIMKQSCNTCKHCKQVYMENTLK